MSSEALERARELARLVRQARLVPESRANALVNALADQVDALLAEVARLEQERDEKDAELWRWMNKPGGINRKYGWIPKQEADELRAALAVAREREQRLHEAIATALASLATGPLKDGYAYSVLDAALVDEPAAAEPCHICGRPRNEPGEMFCSAWHPLAAATLAEPGKLKPTVSEATDVEAPHSQARCDPGSASAAADDGRCPGCGWYVADCNCVARAAADEPGETP